MNEKYSTSSVCCALVAGICFGAGGAISQVVASLGFEIVDITCAQLVSAMLVLGVVCFAKRYKTPNLHACLKLAILGIFNAATTYCYYLAIDKISVSCAVSFQFQYVWIVLVFECISSKVVPSVKLVICAALIIPGSLLGSGLVDEVLAQNLDIDIAGIFIAIACAIFYAAYMHLNAKIELSYPPLQRTFFTMVGASVVGVVATSIMKGGLVNVSVAPFGLVMGVIMSATPCACLAYASSKLSGSLIAVLSSSELPVAVLVGAAVLGEAITPLKVVGVILVCASIAVSNICTAKR